MKVPALTGKLVRRWTAIENRRKTMQASAPTAARTLEVPLNTIGVRVRPKPRYYTELAQPHTKFMSEWKVANIVFDSVKHDADGAPEQVALCSSYTHAQLIVDALNYGAVVA